MTASPDPVLPPGSGPRSSVTASRSGSRPGAYGISFGAISVAAGLDVWQTCALSLLVFTGASQFALVGVVAAGGSPLSGAVTATPARHPQHALRHAPRAPAGMARRRRGAAAHLLIDESTAMSVTRETHGGRAGRLPVHRARGVRAVEPRHLGGALAGGALGDPRTYGLDAAVGGAFLALLWPRLKDRRNQLAAVLAAALALSLVPVAPAGVPVLAAAVVALVVGVVSHATDPTEVPGRDDLPGGGEHSDDVDRDPPRRPGLLPAQAGRAVDPEQVLEHPLVSGSPTCCRSRCWPPWSPCRCSRRAPRCRWTPGWRVSAPPSSRCCCGRRSSSSCSSPRSPPPRLRLL